MEEGILQEFKELWERYWYIKNHKESDEKRSETILNQVEIELNLLCRLIQKKK